MKTFLIKFLQLNELFYNKMFDTKAKKESTIGKIVKMNIDKLRELINN